ncbi:MAG: hypothetical protein WBY28_11165 [Nitrososphaeraceae archaeon]
MSNVSSTGDEDDYYPASSTILTSRFGYASAKLIHSVEKNLYVVLAVILSIATLSILNTLGILNYLHPENVDYFVDLTLSIVLIVVVIPLVFLIVKSRRVLDNWNDMFEKNTITTSMNITMKERTELEALKALAFSVREISEPLQAYLESKKSDLSEFFNVNTDAHLKFNILLDANHVLNNRSTVSNDLIRTLQDFGPVVVRIIDGSIDKNTVQSFVNSLSTYASLTKTNIGLGLIIGEEIQRDAQDSANKLSYLKRRKINNLLLLAKLSIPSIQE